jgi:hypothetical protein
MTFRATDEPSWRFPLRRRDHEWIIRASAASWRPHAAAFEAFREMLPEMPEKQAKVEANHAIVAPQVSHLPQQTVCTHAETHVARPGFRRA